MALPIKETPEFVNCATWPRKSKPSDESRWSARNAGVWLTHVIILPTFPVKHIRRFNLLIWITWVSTLPTAVAHRQVSATLVPPADTTRPLFAVDAPVSLTLTTGLRMLLRDRGEEPVAHPAHITYMDDRQQLISLPLTLKVRGNFRRNRTNCPFPPLLIDFPKKKTRHTLFAHQNKLKLVTHCRVDEWVVREYLLYKAYNLLTNLSFQAQLSRVTYADSLGKRTPETHWAFLLEDDADMAKRNGLELSNLKQTTVSYADSLQMATVAVFEYMIGNTDWSVPYLHNIRLVGNAQTYPLPVPYDFDHAGIVETDYALPAQQLQIQSVRERVYRGLVYPLPVFERVFARFNDVKPQLYALYQTDSRLDKGYVKRTLRYLDEFYALIQNPAPARAQFSKDVQAGGGSDGVK